MRLRTFLLLSAVVLGPVHLATYIPACPSSHSNTVEFMPVIGKAHPARRTDAPVAVYHLGEIPPQGYDRVGTLTVYGGTGHSTYTSLFALAMPQACLHGGDALIERDSRRVNGRPQITADVVRYTN